MGSGLLCITRKNPIASALWLVVTLFALAALFVLLDAQFIAVLQVLVYAGAIMVLFLFVIMLLNLGPPDPSGPWVDRKSTRLNSSHGYISYAVFCLKKKKQHLHDQCATNPKND